MFIALEDDRWVNVCHVFRLTKTKAGRWYASALGTDGVEIGGWVARDFETGMVCWNMSRTMIEVMDDDYIDVNKCSLVEFRGAGKPKSKTQVRLVVSTKEVLRTTDRKVVKAIRGALGKSAE